jgi:hypothetical protein
MKDEPDDLIITDTSPLITFAIADHLHVLTLPKIRVVIPDAVYFEATRYESAPGASRLIEWANTHDDLVTIRPTETGLDQLNRLREGRSIRGMGETAALEVLETDSKNHPDRYHFLIFEDRDIEKRTIILPERAFAISTGDWLRTLENVHLIQSADKILDQAAEEGRKIDRQRKQISRDAAINAAKNRLIVKKKDGRGI